MTTEEELKKLAEMYDDTYYKRGVQEGKAEEQARVLRILDERMNPNKLKHDCGECDYCVLKAQIKGEGK